MYKFVLLALLATSAFGNVIKFDGETEPQPNPQPTPKVDHELVCLACNDTFGLVSELIGCQQNDLKLEEFKEYIIEAYTILQANGHDDAAYKTVHDNATEKFIKSIYNYTKRNNRYGSRVDQYSICRVFFRCQNLCPDNGKWLSEGIQFLKQQP